MAKHNGGFTNLYDINDIVDYAGSEYFVKGIESRPEGVIWYTVQSIWSDFTITNIPEDRVSLNREDIQDKQKTEEKPQEYSDFEIIVGFKTESLESKMDNALKNGYTPCGGVFYSPKDDLYMQAVYKINK